MVEKVKRFLVKLCFVERSLVALVMVVRELDVSLKNLLLLYANSALSMKNCV